MEVLLAEHNELTLKQQIENILKEHPTWRSRKICKILGVSRETIRYHIDPNFKNLSYKRVAKSRKENPTQKKVTDFHGRETLRNRKKLFNKTSNNRSVTGGNKFTTKDLLNKLGNEPKCYLTGRPINLNNPSEYNLDHIIPVSKNGGNSLENCGLACKCANQSKTDMTPEEFFALCKEVLEYNGYTVTKNGVNGQLRSGDGISTSA